MLFKLLRIYYFYTKEQEIIDPIFSQIRWNNHLGRIHIKDSISFTCYWFLYMAIGIHFLQLDLAKNTQILLIDSMILIIYTQDALNYLFFYNFSCLGKFLQYCMEFCCLKSIVRVVPYEFHKIMISSDVRLHQSVNASYAVIPKIFLFACR